MTVDDKTTMDDILWCATRYADVSSQLAHLPMLEGNPKDAELSASKGLRVFKDDRIVHMLGEPSNAWARHAYGACRADLEELPCTSLRDMKKLMSCTRAGICPVFS